MERTLSEAPDFVISICRLNLRMASAAGMSRLIEEASETGSLLPHLRYCYLFY